MPQEVVNDTEGWTVLLGFLSLTGGADTLHSKEEGCF